MQVRARDLVDSSIGKVAFRMPIRFSGTDGSIRGSRASPVLGADRRDVLHAAGLEEREIAALAAARAI